MFRPSLHTIGEVAELIRKGEQVSDNQDERDKLADWLNELERSRDAIYEARVALAKSGR